MATTPSIDVQQNWWHVSMVEAQEAPRKLRTNSMFLAKLLQQQQGRFQLEEVKRDLQRKGLSKNNLAVQITQAVTPAFGTNAGSTSACTLADEDGYISRIYMLDKMVTQKMTIDREAFKCQKQTDEALIRRKFSDFWYGLHEQIAQAAEALLYSKNGTSFAYIGALPSLTNPGAPRPFDVLPLLKADGLTVNPTGLLTFQQDMMAVGAGEDYFALGAIRAMAYAKAQQMTVPNLSGYNVGAINDDLPAAKMLNSYAIGNAFLADGITNPLLVIEDGALQFASAPYFNTMEVVEGKGQKFWSMEHPNLPGVWVNITETINEVCELNTYPTTTWTGTIIFNLIGKMTCDYDGGFFSEGNSGVYLYDIVCSDAGMCNLDNRTTNFPSYIQTFGKECEAEPVCDTACRLDMLPIGYKTIAGENYAVFTVVFTPAAGGSQPTSYVWEINGSVVVGETENSLIIALADLNDGDVVTVEAIGSANCTAVTAFEPFVLPEGLCGTISAVLSPTLDPVLNGSTINAGSFAKNAVIDAIRVNISALINNINVVSAVCSGAYATLTVSPALPDTLIVGGANMSLDMALSTAVGGNYTSTVTVTSNACDAVFTYTVNWTVA
jgi:hypothetical protein